MDISIRCPLPSINADEYNKEQHLRTITEVKRIYDVAIVDIPAYESTSVQARSFFEAEAEREAAEAVERKRLLDLEIAKVRLLG